MDLPAPFSPSREWTWPDSTVRSIESLAVKAPNFLVMPRNSSFTVLQPFWPGTGHCFGSLSFHP
ncbi:hypothetical protein ACFFX0_28840 [Citricoccus parietis]|uniref:Uncharacterized protein n=1 Tax=Citricoccus parietis TaxID=592307 RepID=A0ABV5G7W3_9MICC